MSDQALFADLHLPADHCADEVAVCHMAVQRADGQVGQLRCGLLGIASGCSFISFRRASTSLIFREYTVAFENKRLFTQKTAVFCFSLKLHCAILRTPLRVEALNNGVCQSVYGTSLFDASNFYSFTGKTRRLQ